MGKFLQSLLLFLTAFCGLISRSQAQVKTYTLDEAIQAALANSTTALKAQNAVLISGDQVLAAYGQFLPDFAVGANYAYTGGTTLTSVTAPILVDSRRSNVGYSVLTTLNIFNGYSDYASLKAARLNKQSSELSLERAKQYITFDITQSYLQITLDRQIADFAAQNLETSKQREAQLDELVRVGRRAQSDLYQQQSQTALDQQFLTNALNKLRNDKILLVQKLRINATDDYDFNDPLPDENSSGVDYTNETALVQKALDQRVDLKSSANNREAANWTIRRYRGGYLPKVFVSGGAYGVAANYNKLVVNGVETPTSTVRPIGTQLGKQVFGVGSLNATWTIFDKFYTKSNVAIAQVGEANATIDYENTKLQIVAETRQAFGNYNTALQQIETTEKGLIAAQKAFETVNGRYSVGSSNFIELVITQNNLLLAKQNKAQVTVNLFLQKKTLDYYLGN